jgi:radical SAM protein with 4Fe4S-binding SPASM domain
MATFPLQNLMSEVSERSTTKSSPVAGTLDTYLMDGHKLHWHPERLAQWMRGEPIAPLYIDMGITQTCNVACKFCYYAVPQHRTKAIIPADALIRFFYDAAEIGVKAVGILGDGEPTLHPDLYDCMTEGKKSGLDLAIATNGVSLKQDRLVELLRAVSWVRFTLSSATGKNYEAMMERSSKTFEKVIDNIREAVSIKRDLQLDVTIGIQMVLIDLCADQVVPLAELGQELGVDYFVVKQTSERETTRHGLITQDYGRYEEAFRQAEACSTSEYKVIIKRKKMNLSSRRYDTCHGCAFLPQITGAGRVYNCGNFFNDERFFMGSIVEQSFKDIVASERYRSVLERVANEVNVHRECGTGCRQNEINEHLAMLKSKPPHVNFI